MQMKPCPNCGSAHLSMWESAKEDIYAVKCDNCGLRGPFSTILVPWPQRGAENQAIEKWNELLRREDYDKLLAEAHDLDASGAEARKDLERLKNQLEDLRSKENAQNWACGECQEVEQELKQKVERLEKEADWLAKKLFEFCYNNGCGNTCAGKVTRCLRLKYRLCPVDGCINFWREAARRAVEEQCEK